MMRGLVLAVLMISAATAGVASPAAVKVQLPCESRDQMLSPTGAQAVVLCKEKSIHLVNLPDGSDRLLYPDDRRVNELSYSQDGQWLAAGFDDGTVEVTPARAQPLPGGGRRIPTVSITCPSFPMPRNCSLAR